jgi:hypothetical protein
MTLDQARQRAERNFQKEERQLDARKAMTEYDAQARATREKTARLKALRLAAEAQAQTENPVERPAKPTKRRAHAARNNSSLNFAALRKLRCERSPATHQRGAFHFSQRSQLNS